MMTLTSIVDIEFDIRAGLTHELAAWATPGLELEKLGSSKWDLVLRCQNQQRFRTQPDDRCANLSAGATFVAIPTNDLNSRSISRPWCQGVSETAPPAFTGEMTLDVAVLLGSSRARQHRHGRILSRPHPAATWPACGTPRHRFGLQSVRPWLCNCMEIGAA